jgi:cytochrome c-type biogenesis protein CcmH
MTKVRSFLAAVFLLTVASAPLVIFPASAQQPNDRAHQIGMKLKCMCGGCDQSAGGCYHTGGAFSGPCDTAKGMLAEINTRLTKGQTEQQILQAFEQQFGTAVFIEPPKSGFSLVAWIMPFAYLLGGTLIVVFLINRWSKRPRHRVATAGGPAVSAEYLARARAEAERETDD